MSGHYSRQQWQQFVAGQAEEREQMLEHLTACAQCMEVYTALIEQADSPAPPRGMTEEILSRVTPQKTVVTVLPQLIKLLLSATLAVAVWIGSSVLVPPDANMQAAQARAQQQAARIDEKIQKEQQRARQSKRMDWNWMDLLTGKGGE